MDIPIQRLLLLQIFQESIKKLIVAIIESRESFSDTYSIVVFQEKSSYVIFMDHAIDINKQERIFQRWNKCLRENRWLSRTAARFEESHCREVFSDTCVVILWPLMNNGMSWNCRSQSKVCVNTYMHCDWRNGRFFLKRNYCDSIQNNML